MINLNTIYNENCLNTMAKMPNNFINLIITSPPYYLNKEYEKNISYKDYCDMMELSFIEFNRILSGGGVSYY